KIAQAIGGSGFGADAVGAAIGVRERHVEDAGEQRAETLALNRAAGRERESAHGASMERAVKGDELIALGVILHELDGGFDRFSAGIAEVDALRSFAGGDSSEFFGEFDEVWVVEIRAGHVNQFGGLLLNRSNHVGMAVSRRYDGDSGGEIE